MDENKNPFEKKEMDKEIANILNENPIINQTKSKPDLKTKISGFKLKFPKKKTILIIGVIIIVIGGFMLISNQCEVCNVCEECVQEISLENIKQQIIDKGYAEISDGESNLKLTPYIK